MRRLTISLFAVLAAAGPAAGAGPDRHADDAALRAVQFVDANEGWAVGDDGAIWHSIDSGENWERQKTGVRGSLRALHFVNPFTGWVVGREELPGGGSGGIILVTTDGGLKWTRICLNTLPGLHAVKFFDDRNGIVAGDAHDRYSSGVFATSDGGRTWAIVPGPRQAGWLSADFSDSRTGVLAGAWSSLAMLRESVFGKCDLDTLGGRGILGVRLYRDAALAVGQGGLILRSDDAGGKWRNAAPKSLSAEALTNCDFHAVSLLGEHAWVVGRPGSIVLHSGDDGRSWEILPTGQNMTLHAIQFISPRNGWAVGELGTILGTIDGGKTWKVQRRGGERAAALYISAGPATLPLDALAQLGGDDGYLTAAVRVLCPDPASAALKRATAPQKWAQAVRAAGGAAGESLWHFPLPSYQESLGARELLGAFDRLHGARAGEMMIRHLVLAIRTWQPEIVVGDLGQDGPTTLCDEAVREAFQRAADPRAFPEQLEQLGLKPWSAKKLYATSAVAARGQFLIRVPATEALARSGESARDVARLAADLLDEQVEPVAERGYLLREGRIAGAAAHQNVMEGITLAHGGTARRNQPTVTQAEIQALEEQKKITEAKRNIEALAQPDWKQLGGAEKMVGQLGTMLKGLPPDDGAHAALGVANAFARSGQWMMARQVFELLAARFPGHPLTIEAYRWIARHASSSEARRRLELGQFIAAAEYRIEQTHAAGDGAGRVRNAGFEVRGTETRGSADSADVRNWHQAALALEPKMAAFGTLYLHDPAFQFCLQAARRSLGETETAKKWFARYVGENAAVRTQTPDPWREAAAAELWLADRSTRSTRPAVTCQAAAKRPHLDGLLDDECWQDAKPMPLRSAAGELGADFTGKALICYDREFLYIAVQCQHPAGRQVARVEKRKRDEDLRAYDRVGILLDLDRDYQTCYHLQVDQRGCLCEDCWGDRSWNPKWFVALHSDETSWTAEIAIPLSELTGDPVGPGRVWACNVVRVVPGKGVQAWSLPADIEPRPEGMGLLMFTGERK